MPGYIHHIQWCVSSLDAIRKLLVEGYKFAEIAQRNGRNREAVFQSGEITFLVTEKKEMSDQDCGISYPWLDCCSRVTGGHKIDTVFNVCLEVGNVDYVYRMMKNNGAKALVHPYNITSIEGNIRCAVVSSPCGNVVHSLVNTQQYSGEFLPGFTSLNATTNEEPLLTHIDHVTFVVNEGETDEILDWYKSCCGMERFQIVSGDDAEEETVFTDAGMTLSAGEWISEWMCREEGVMWEEDYKEESRNFKLVIAEPLPNRPDSHVHK